MKDEVGLPVREYTGVLGIGGQDLKCAVLSDGTRVLNAKSVFDALGRSRKGKGVVDQRVANMPSFLDANNLQPYIDQVFNNSDLSDMEIAFISKSGNRNYKGYRAEMLPMVCDVYLKARDAGVLTDSQKRVATVCDLLVRSLAKVGITALIDEATGYQYDRDRDELQRILEKYISKEFLPWAKRFPDEFYIELFRLKGWDFKGKPKSPLVGKLTNELIYKQLPDGILEELRSRNPKDASSGHRSKRHHQLLTSDTGIPHLDKHIASVITLMKACDNWTEFERLFKKSFGLDTQLSLL
jgi:hypothetical protein